MGLYTVQYKYMIMYEKVEDEYAEKQRTLALGSFCRCVGAFSCYSILFKICFVIIMLYSILYFSNEDALFQQIVWSEESLGVCIH